MKKGATSPKKFRNPARHTPLGFKIWEQSSVVCSSILWVCESFSELSFFFHERWHVYVAEWFYQLISCL